MLGRGHKERKCPYVGNVLSKNGFIGGGLRSLYAALLLGMAIRSRW